MHPHVGLSTCGEPNEIKKKYPPEKTQLPPVFVVQAMLVPSSFGVAFAHNGTDGVPGHQHGVHAPAFAAVYGGYVMEPVEKER